MHEYLRRLNAVTDLLLTYTTMRDGGAHDVEVKHDSWCKVYRHKFCNCDPQITIRTANGQIFRVLADGKIEQIILT